MPGRNLSDEGFTGFFGKLPFTGDFVARGLPDVFRARWDDWVTRHLARRKGDWPEGGIRLALVSGTRTASGVIMPSRDSQGRSFPLSLFFVLPGAAEAAEIDAWCDTALIVAEAALAGRADADDLWEMLESLPGPRVAAPPRHAAPEAALRLWTRAHAPAACDPAAPGDALDALFSSGESPTP